MKKELDDQLCAKYPKIFAERHMSMQDTCMCWGFECGDGWYDLLDKLCEKIQNHVDVNPGMPQVVASQVKEKFGSLRFYVNGADDQVYDFIDEAERVSGRTCEDCGKEGKVRGSGWISVKCDEHAPGATK
jgi:hypothetical protein